MKKPQVRFRKLNTRFRRVDTISAYDTTDGVGNGHLIPGVQARSGICLADVYSLKLVFKNIPKSVNLQNRKNHICNILQLFSPKGFSFTTYNHLFNQNNLGKFALMELWHDYCIVYNNNLKKIIILVN